MPPSPEPPLVAVGFEVTLPEVPLLPTVPDFPDVASPPTAAELELPLVPLVVAPVGPELAVPVPPLLPPLPVPALLLTVEFTAAGGVLSAKAATAVAPANTIPSPSAANAPSTRPALAGELTGALNCI